MDQHLSQLRLGNLIVIDDFLSLKVENSEVLVLTNGVHIVSLSIDPGVDNSLTVDLVLSKLSVLHWRLDINFDWDDSSVVATDDKVVQVGVPAEALGW
jgi:hypothetical protein